MFHEKAVNLLGAGTVIDLKHLCGEIERVREKGVPITRDSLKISDRAVMVLPIHPMQDKWEEARWARITLAPRCAASAPSMATST